MFAKKNKGDCCDKKQNTDTNKNYIHKTSAYGCNVSATEYEKCLDFLKERKDSV